MDGRLSRVCLLKIPDPFSVVGETNPKVHIPDHVMTLASFIRSNTVDC